MCPSWWEHGFEGCRIASRRTALHGTQLEPSCLPSEHCGPTKRPKFGGNYDDRSEQALHPPLTTDNSALVLVDHQVGLMTGVRDYETGELKHNVVALAKAAKVLRIPTVVTTTARDSMWGPTFPELVEVVGGEHIIDRSSV